jgi:hypothetical protein
MPIPTRLLATALALLATSTAMAIEEPRFEVLEQDGAFELREYAPYLVAETRVEADFESAGNVAFQRLFRYISGNNTAQQKIAMTAPVTQPSDPTVEIRAVPARLVAAWRYSGRWTTANYQEHESELRHAIAARGLKVTGDPILARYNPPFMPSFLRRNEVLIPVERKTKH